MIAVRLSPGAARVTARLIRLPQMLLVGVVKAYRLLLSPWLGSGCRFEPTCSVYALHALEQRGAIMGSCLTLHRLMRCQPWCAGGLDPVPPANRSASLFSRLIHPATPLSSAPSSEKTPS